MSPVRDASPPHKTVIPEVLAFPVDAQSSPFFCALASVLLVAHGYREDTPFYCGRQRQVCIDCGSCGSKTTLAKHHQQLYHDYQTVTGVGLGWDWPQSYDILYIMHVAGLAYERLGRTAGRERIWSALAASVDRGLPALLKLGDGPDWHVGTGYDGVGALYGLDAHTHPAGGPAVAPDGYTGDGLCYITDWYGPLVEAIVVTCRTPSSAELGEMLQRMIAQLALPEQEALEAEVMRRIDAVHAGDAPSLAHWLNGLAGFAVEARWHAAECCGATLALMADEGPARQGLYAATDTCLRTHDLCWEIWGQLGVGPRTGYGYAVTPKAAERVLRDETRAELRRLFGAVFANDRAVLGLLRGIVAAGGV